MKKILNKTKIKQKRGTGHGVDYIPWIFTSEFSSTGTCSNPIDWKTGRTVQLLSQGEAMVWHILRWNDKVSDIREQFPLDSQIINHISRDKGYNFYLDDEHVMTTDFLVDLIDGSQMAVSVKSTRSVFENEDANRKNDIEKTYWEKEKGIKFMNIFKDEIDEVMYLNIRLVSQYYDANRVFDESSMLKHLIARKIIKIDMSKQIDIRVLKQQFRPMLEINSGLDQIEIERKA